MRLKRIFCALLGLFCLLTLAGGCGAGENVNENVNEERDYANGIFGYTIPAGWSISEKYSTAHKTFYVMDGHEDDGQPDNISVELKTNRYAADEHEKFREAITGQLLMQLQGVPATLTGEGTFTDNGDVLYIFTITEDATEEQLAADPEAVGVITRQYYIVGDKKYALVHLTNFSGSEETQAAADRLAKSFILNGDNEEEA